MADLDQILNWRRWDNRISMSGQPSEAERVALRDADVTTIINLGPHDNKGALDDEPASVAALGMRYIYIPVDFDNPADADFGAFCAAMDEVQGERVHVHCIYNARVSAFFYRYAKEDRGGSVEGAEDIMESIWRPGGKWARFVGRDEAVDDPNTYKGYEY